MPFSKLAHAAALLAIVSSPLAAQTPKPTPLSAADSTRFMELGRTYVRWMLQGKADSLVAVMDAEYLESTGGPVGVSDRLGKIAERGGKEVKVLIEKLTRRNGQPQFWHEAEFSAFTDEPVVFRIVFDEKGKVVRIGLSPKSQAEFDQ